MMLLEGRYIWGAARSTAELRVSRRRRRGCVTVAFKVQVKGVRPGPEIPVLAVLSLLSLIPAAKNPIRTRTQ